MGNVAWHTLITLNVQKIIRFLSEVPLISDIVIFSNIDLRLIFDSFRY